MSLLEHLVLDKWTSFGSMSWLLECVGERKNNFFDYIESLFLFDNTTLSEIVEGKWICFAIWEHVLQLTNDVED